MGSLYEERFIYDEIKQEGFPFAHCSNITEIDENTLVAQWYTGKGEQARNQSIFAARFDRTSDLWSEPYLLSKTT